MAHVKGCDLKPMHLHMDRVDVTCFSAVSFFASRVLLFLTYGLRVISSLEKDV
jgi:hypothetical protein